MKGDEKCKNLWWFRGLGVTQGHRKHSLSIVRRVILRECKEKRHTHQILCSSHSYTGWTNDKKVFKHVSHAMPERSEIHKSIKDNNLARSAKLLTGLYILLALISSFFLLWAKLSHALLDRFSRSFHQMKAICVNFLDPDLILIPLGKICSMTFIQHAGILQRIRMSQFGLRGDKKCNFGEDRSTNPISRREFLYLLGQNGKNRHIIPNISASTGPNFTNFTTLVGAWM